MSEATEKKENPTEVDEEAVNAGLYSLAQAILEKLYDCGAKTVATTHYSEIKAFAMTHAGMQNASMEFDVDRLCPTYHLH